uniref:Kinocilin n=1 Tax=Echeneis naucrates TaxID=173247 RepID=A0A665T8N2_ECHNA
MDMLFLWQLQAFVDGLGIVAGCIIIGVSRECDADAVGGIFLGAGGLGLLISIYPFIKAWLNINHVLPSFGSFVHYSHGYSSNMANTVITGALTDVSTKCSCLMDV